MKDNGLDSQTKKILVISAISVVGIIGIAILIWYINKIRSANQEARDLKKEINPKDVTLSPSEVTGLADGLWAAIADGLTEDEDTVFGIMNKLQTLSDWKSVELAFNQKYSNVSSYWQKGNLNYWVYNKTPELVPEINQILSKFGGQV